MGIKINLPERVITKKEEELRIKRILGDDFNEKKGILSKILIFLNVSGSMSITELTSMVNDRYKFNLDRVNIHRFCDKLLDLGLINKESIGRILILDEEEKNSQHKHAEAKHRKFLYGINTQFKERFNNINYVWLSNGILDDYLEWSCKLNNIPYEKDEKK